MKVEKKLTAEDKRRFERLIKGFAETLCLKDYQYEFRSVSTTEYNAKVNIDGINRIAVFFLNREIVYDDNEKDYLKKLAFHEVTHLLLHSMMAGINMVAGNEHMMTFSAQEHSIIRKLENMMETYFI